jgi:hypothetical protein
VTFSDCLVYQFGIENLIRRDHIALVGCMKTRSRCVLFLERARQILRGGTFFISSQVVPGIVDFLGVLWLRMLANVGGQ